MNWKDYFQTLQDWKQLPAYKVEPRIDSLVGYYLPMILADFLKVQIVGIIPELPIRLGTIKPSHEGSSYADRSYKVDFIQLGIMDITILLSLKLIQNPDEMNRIFTLLRLSQLALKSLLKVF